MALSAAQLATIASDLTTLEASFRNDKSTYLGTVSRGVYSGAGVNSARSIAAKLANSPPDNVTTTAAEEAARQALLARARAISS